MSPLEQFHAQGFLRFPASDETRHWAAQARPHAAAAAQDPAQAHWLRCGGTWFVGVDALPNDAAGRVGDGPPLSGAAMDFITRELQFDLPLHRAQVSICYPGYPQPSLDETESAYRFRRNRDAAHVDGLLAEGPEKRRRLKEPHAYILGLALTEQSGDASPLTVWEGSHGIMGPAFAKVFEGHPPDSWPGVDLTDAYQQARKQVFASCPRLVLPSGPGEAVVLHRHLVHGVAPWGAAATAPPEGRMIAYFRPEFPQLADWLRAP